MSESPSREGSYLIVIMILGCLCIGCAVWGVQQRTALRESEKEAQLCQNDMAAYKRRVAAEKKAAEKKAAEARQVPAGILPAPPRKATLVHHRYRSLFPPVAPGVMLGQPLQNPDIKGMDSILERSAPKTK